DPQTAQSGYSFMHRERGLIAYNLHEPGMERLLAPGIPYARDMLGARTVHEWAHRAADAGWVPRSVDEGRWRELTGAFAEQLERLLAAAPRHARELAPAGVGGARDARAAGAFLCEAFLSRLPDYQANLVADHFWSPAEREAYVLQNIRPLRAEYTPD